MLETSTHRSVALPKGFANGFRGWLRPLSWLSTSEEKPRPATRDVNVQVGDACVDLTPSLN